MLKTRAVIVGLVCAIAAGVLVFFGLHWVRVNVAGGGPRPVATPMLLREIQSLAQLVSVKYVMEKVVILEDVKWYGENRILLLAHGVVKAGVDLTELKPEDIQVQEGTIRVALPRANITDVYLDENRSQVIEHTTGMLRTFDKTLEQNARRQAVTDMRIAARHAGIQTEAEERARLQLGNLFRQLGYEVEFLPPR